MVRGPKVYWPDFHQIIDEHNRRCIDDQEQIVVTNFVSAFAVFHSLYR
jgi:hypothetical protein